MTIDFGVGVELSIAQGAWKVSIAMRVFKHSGGVNGIKRAYYGYFS